MRLRTTVNGLCKKLEYVQLRASQSEQSRYKGNQQRLLLLSSPQLVDHRINSDRSRFDPCAPAGDFPSFLRQQESSNHMKIMDTRLRGYDGAPKHFTGNHLSIYQNFYSSPLGLLDLNSVVISVDAGYQKALRNGVNILTNWHLAKRRRSYGSFFLVGEYEPLSPHADSYSTTKRLKPGSGWRGFSEWIHPTFLY